MAIRERKVRMLFEKKFVDYRNKIYTIYENIADPELKQELKHFLELEQGDIKNLQ